MFLSRHRISILSIVRKLFSRYEIVPVGWGYMAVHTDIDRGVSVITDGGAIPTCFRDAITTAIASLNDSLFYQEKWAWIISHLDYDHVSITLRLIEEGLIAPPKLIVLPQVYSQKWCREAIAKMRAYCIIVQHILHITMPKLKAPRYLDLLKTFNKIVSNTWTVGVNAGTILRLGSVEYVFLWPNEKFAADVCKEVADELEDKIVKFCKNDRACYEMAEKELNNVMENIEPLANIERIDTKSVDLSKLMREYPQGSRLGTAEEKETEQSPDFTLEILTEVAQKLGDKTILSIAAKLINATSLAYVLRLRRKELTCVVTVSPYSDYLLRIICYSPSLVLYPSDLSDEALDEAINSCLKLLGDKVVVEVAPHHGQEHAPKLNLIQPYISYVSRCDRHRPRAWMINRQYIQSTRSRTTRIVFSEHLTNLVLNY